VNIGEEVLLGKNGKTAESKNGGILLRVQIKK